MHRLPSPTLPLKCLARNYPANRLLPRLVPLKYREDVVGDLENAPKAFQGLLRGENCQKLLVRVSPDPPTQRAFGDLLLEGHDRAAPEG